MKRVLITGGCGFIGSNFVHFLLGKADERTSSIERVVNLDVLTYAGNPENLSDWKNDERYRFVQGDIADADKFEALLREEQIDTIINFAAESHVDRSIDSPEPFFQTNVIGTLRLFDAARRYWNNLEGSAKEAFRLLHVSTDEVYGSLGNDDPAFTERTPYAPNSPYSASKAASDFIARAGFHTYGMPVLVTNCSNNYGPLQFPEKLIPLMILNALDGKDLPIYGDGMNVRDWLYVEDHCRGIYEVALRGKLGETYNIGGLNEQPNIHIVEQICALLDELSPREDGKSYIEQKTYVKDRPGHDRRYAIDCTKIDNELGWKPRESFETGLKKTVQWYLDNRQWCDNIQNYKRERLGNA